MIIFWVVAGSMAAAAAGLILVRARQAASLGEVADPTAVLYRRQLAEIDELAHRGLIADAERRGAHAEAARRLLAASDRSALAWTAEAGARRPLLAVTMLAPLLALGLYLAVGAPGTPDQPFISRLVHWRAAPPETLSPAEMAAVLQQIVRQRPDDPEGLRYLAIAQGAAQNPAGAVRAMRQAVKVAPGRADLWEMLGEAIVLQAGGDLTPEANAAFREALKRDPKAIGPRFELGRAKVAAGDVAGGLADWRALRDDLPADDPRRNALDASIAQARGEPPARAGSPTLAGDQMTAVRSMVAGLAERLKARPNDPEGWVRLVRAYAVLGEAAKRDVTLKQALARYAGQPKVLAELSAAAAAEPLQ